MDTNSFLNLYQTVHNTACPEYFKEECRIKRAYKYRSAPLKDLCIRSIALNISYFVDKYKDLKSEHSDLEYAPFELLPLTDLVQIQDMCVDECKKSPELLAELFVTSEVTTVELRNIVCRPDQSLFLSMKTRCVENLSTLAVTECIINTSLLNDALQQLTNLTQLNLSRSNIGDDTLSIISTYLTLLEELNLTGTKITEDGLYKSLCAQPLRNLNVLELKHSLRPKLSVRYTLFNILKSHPELLRLEHEYIIDALFIWASKFPGRTLNIKTLQIYINDEHRAQYDYNIILALCPRLIGFELRNNCFKFSNLPYPLLFKFNQLCTLTLHRLAPWFKSKSVQAVNFSDITINIVELVSAFPNIRFLCLEDCVLECSPNQYKSGSIFKQLQVLDFTNCDFGSCIDFVKDLLYAKSLEMVRFTGCKFANNLIIDSRIMHFQHIYTDCMLSPFLEEIIARNKELQAVIISSKTIRGYACKHLNVHLNKMILGETSKFFSEDDNDQLQKYIKYYDRDVANRYL